MARDRRTADMTLWIEKLKETVRCTDCGFSDFRAIDFHHPLSALKEKSISTMIHGGYSLKRIKAEISKCIPLCANCHRILHWDERWSRDD